MRNLLFLYLCFLASGCATEPTPATTTDNKALSSKEEPQSPNLENLKIGMPRAEAERILGEPSSVTDTATETTSVWVFGQGALKAAPPTKPKNDSKMVDQIGSIAATTAGIFIPYAGVVTSIGSQVYSMGNSGDENATPSIQGKDNTRIVTIEFRDNKVFSIQRARPIAIPLSPSSTK